VEAHKHGKNGIQSGDQSFWIKAKAGIHFWALIVACNVQMIHTEQQRIQPSHTATAHFMQLLGIRSGGI
jgi:hypothetical protein